LNSKSKFKINKGNLNLAGYKGTIEAEVLNGNVVVGSGKLDGASTIHCQSGNINAKTDIIKTDNYNFEVDTGNIELSFPNQAILDFSCQGNVISNMFKSSVNGSKIIVSSKQGSINIKKY
jgi:hypothetical protein